MRHFWNFLTILLISSLLVFPVTGCNQSKINTAVTDIGNVALAIGTAAAGLQADLALFNGPDAAAISAYVSVLAKDAPVVSSLCKQYVANPSPTVLGQITSELSEIATNDAAAILNLAQVKNSGSQAEARAVLATIATLATVASGYLSVAGASITPAAKSSLNQLKPSINRTIAEQNLELAKNQGLVSDNATLASFGL